MKQQLWLGDSIELLKALPFPEERENYISKIEEGTLSVIPNIPKSWENIQDYLIDIGFEVDTIGECFYKWTTGWTKVIIPFSELSGKSIAHFQKKAKEENWI